MFGDYEIINSAIPLYLIIGKADGYIEENNGNKYLVFTSTDGNKKILPKFTKFWGEIKHVLETIDEGKEGAYEKDFVKIKLNSDDNLPWDKMLQLLTVRSTFEKDGKYYRQTFLDECLYEA